MAILNPILVMDNFERLWAALISGYGLLVVAGGVTSYRRDRNEVSLVLDVASGVALLTTAYRSFESPPVGMLIATAIALVLSIVFMVRWYKTRAFMPAGLLTEVSLVAVLVFFSAFMFEMRTVS